MEGAGKGGGEGGEVRRIHIIYFLYRMGRIEHPHLVRVHHLNRNGVYLRDVKRWLADLRGKNMPEAFTWSYKRRYKNGYVWQDLLDDDLITPISDNEFVLKGSEIIPTTPFGPSPYGENRASSLVTNDDDAVEVEQQQRQPSSPNNDQQPPQPKTNAVLTKSSSEIYRESHVFGSERSTLTDDSMKHEEEMGKQNFPEKFENSYSSSSFYSHLLNKNEKKTDNNINAENNITKMGTSPTPSLSSSSSPSYSKTKSYSNGASQMFRNLISCGAVDTDDTVLVRLNRADKPNNNAEICKGEKLGGSARVFGTSWNNQRQQHTARKSFDGMKGSKQNKQQTEFCSPTAVSAAHKPVRGPTCSQCGKSFKPEKMHSHMKSCRGMKALSKTCATYDEKTPLQRAVNSPNEDSTSGYFLTS